LDIGVVNVSLDARDPSRRELPIVTDLAAAEEAARVKV
jgi:hypothetical protein